MNNTKLMSNFQKLFFFEKQKEDMGANWNELLYLCKISS